MSEATERRFRHTEQRLMRSEATGAPSNGYHLYPTHPVPEGSISVGHRRIAELLQGQTVATFDGYVGVLWDEFRARLDAELAAMGIQAEWHDASDWLRGTDEIDQLVEPFLGGDDPLFGTRFSGTLANFFAELPGEPTVNAGAACLAIAYGCGAALAEWSGPLFYLDLPKNELQFRSRAGVVRNLGATSAAPPKPQYKRFYFVDWPALNRHKRDLAPRLTWLVDEQDPDAPAVIAAETFRDALREQATSVFRVRPWFEPGPWGGQWLRELAPELPGEPPNYAWSFELIVPENGLVICDGASRLEFSFDWLMHAHHREVLGRCADRFGFEFPIRFDYLDTMDGGNLSVQCHPRPDYIRKQFGELFTQDECYYLMDCRPGAKVFLGFQPDIDPDAFRKELEHSRETGAEVDVERHVRPHPAEKHGLYLIPSGTVHCSGADCVVLEISATPYIFTFKMYDWLRLDLEGKPRPLNIERAYANLDFGRRGQRADTELISQHAEIDRGDGWRIVHLPTHAEHFYDVHRVEFSEAVEVGADGSPHVLMLVEGEAVEVEAGGRSVRYAYGETFVVPAAAGSYRLVNVGDGEARVIKAFVKHGA
ncbi:putative mannose-6-phosphate isomerase YvyI [Posidoniimonas polymericola]|uniref:Putative mannose-6-phosphate isomerase YvyI n=1 Tax=Posidoniimonas polymericola TaxID=2528002 RepID=A0A5C5YLL1_9BACT|nr:class I mannose-6-phosphate isomerase [Posidoniimonas polymericola]TWT75638.1 putative mannose-6-phosphate isomerase YvyI [Posidoniimonas polymericola]